VLIAAQIAVTVVLLFGAGLMVRSVARMAELRPGFRADGLLTATMLLPQTGYPDSAAKRQAMDRLLSRVGATPPMLGAAVFALLMLIATGIHWDRFNHGDAPTLAAIAFYAWTIVYIASPFAVFAIWWRNRATDPREPAADDPLVTPSALLAARVFAAGALAAGSRFFVVPAIAVDIWPWQLTPLTARVLASLTVQVGVGALVLSRDPRWSAWRLIVQTFLVATALLLIGAIRAFGDFDTSNPMTWLYLGGLLGTAGALALLHLRMEGSQHGRMAVQLDV